jgi:hypothetical protein
MRAEGEAVLGRMKSLGGFSDSEARVEIEEEVVVFFVFSAPAAASAAALARVLAMVVVLAIAVCIVTGGAITKKIILRDVLSPRVVEAF